MLDVPALAKADLVDIAREAVALRQQDPRRAIELAESILHEPSGPPRAQVIALLAKALATRELGDLNGARELHHRAISHGLAHALDDEVAQVRSALVALLCDLGDPEASLVEADLAEPHLAAAEKAELEMRRAISYERIGRIDDAINSYSRAVRGIDQSGDDIARARVRCNRGIALVYNGREDEATKDFEVAEMLATRRGHGLLAGGAAHNLGFAHGRRGDLVAALDAFDRAERLYRSVGFPGRARGVFEADRCGVLLSAGLLGEARRAADRAIKELEALEEVIELAEARLLLARACLACEDFEAAAESGAEAAKDFDRAGRKGWAVMARYVTLRGKAELGDEGWLDEADDVVSELVSHGWGAEADDVRIFTARNALRRGDSRRARAALSGAAAARLSGRADRRAQAWLAAAMLREADGNLRGARSALRSGLKVLDDHRDLLGATELRVGASSHAAALASMGVALALDRGRPADVLVWADRLRASALDRPPTRPPDDAALAAELADLRAATAELTEARLTGRDDGEDLHKVARLEAAIRDRARRATDTGQTEAVSFGVGSVRAVVGDGMFIEYLEHDGRLHAVAVDGRRSRLHDLGSLDGLDQTLDAAHFALRRLAGGSRSDAARRAASDALDAQLLALSDRLLLPIASDGDAPIAIVPTGSLHRVPWSALHLARGRAVTVSPSGSLWLSGSSRAPGRRRRTTVFVAGPDLVGGRSEVKRLRRANSDSTILTGRNATVARTIDALGTAGVAHIAAHGDFRADNPMFSSLRLHDGALTLYDLEGLRSVPHTVVLPACDAGAAKVSIGDEVTGTATALLGLGVAGVIAPIAPVSDHAATPIMVRFHRALVRGLDPAAALTEATALSWQSDDPAAHAASAALTCFGTGRGRNRA